MPPHDAAVQQLENLGAKLKWDASNQVILVDLSSCITANAGLDHVQYLPHVATLVLPALVDDSGLRSIGKLAALERLDLRPCGSITDARMVDVARLINLQVLTLPPQISDAGLKPLVSLSNLRQLNVSYCRSLTDAGLTTIAALD